MTCLKFDGDITLDEVFNQNRLVIYNRLVEAISESYTDLTIKEVAVIMITINNFDYTINLTRNKFIGGLESAIAAFEYEEEYEKCQSCLNIINELKNQDN